MGRMFRLKADLQQVVVSSEYAKAKFKTSTDGEASTMIIGANDPVKTILLDEDGFWNPLVEALKIMTPIVKLLRLADGNGAAMGKIYPRMVSVRKHIESSSVAWKAEALKIHDERWAYLKSDMHLAGYALDPEYISDEITGDVQTALITIAERMALRSEVIRLTLAGQSQAALSLTTGSESVEALVGETMLQLASYQVCKLRCIGNRGCNRKYWSMGGCFGKGEVAIAILTSYPALPFQDREGIFAKNFIFNNAKEMPPAKWWNSYGKAVPLLSSVACSVLSQPVCASAAERNWSIYGSIKMDKRVSLQHATSDRLVYCHEALHLRVKLQKSGYKEPVVKWHSDCESDDGSSDEEDLKV